MSQASLQRPACSTCQIERSHRDSRQERRTLGHYVPAGKILFVPPPEDQCLHPEVLARSDTEGMTLAQFWKQNGGI